MLQAVLQVHAWCVCKQAATCKLLMCLILDLVLPASLHAAAQSCGKISAASPHLYDLDARSRHTSQRVYWTPGMELLG